MHYLYSPVSFLSRPVGLSSAYPLLGWVLIPFFFLFTHVSNAQSSPQAKEVFELINMARLKPSDFLAKHRESIEECSPQFVKMLETSSPIQKVIWDNGLEVMARQQVLDNNLNPQYPGKMNDFYLSSSGKGGSSAGFASIRLLCNFYTIINDPAASHFAIYMTATGYAFQWGRSKTISSRKPYVYPNKPDSSKVDFAKLHTARDQNYMSEFDRLMIREINFARVYPAVYADIVGFHMMQRSEDWGGLSKDEILATNELIDELKKAKPASLIYPKECLYRAAEKHGLDCKKRGFIDHTGSNGASPFKRIADFCNGVQGNENIVGTVNGNIRSSVIALLVDNGISSRGHRYNMLNRYWNFVGTYSYIEDKQENPKYFITGACIQNFSK
jgi:hypothetical protein